MALDKTHPALAVLPQPTPYHLHQYPASAPLPSWTGSASDFLSITRTPHELSIVYAGESRQEDNAVEYEGPWRALRVAGPMELTMTGVLHALTGPLKEASIPIFALSTWNTDYVLIPWAKTDEAVVALKADGWTVEH